MRTVMLGGAPGVGKSTVARCLLTLAGSGPNLVQWVDVDDLWLHQPWRVDDRMKKMVQANLRAVASHAAQADVDILLITWVLQSTEMHDLVAALLPFGATTMSVQLRASSDTWRQRFETSRPELTDFYRTRYEEAQSAPADHVIDTDGLDPSEAAHRVAALIELARK